MQLTRAADYAVRVMVFLVARRAGERATLPEIAKTTGAPGSFLSKVLQGLTRARLVTSRQGPAGGFEISPLGRRASMRAVIEAIDGPVHLNVCLRTRQPCPRKDRCPAHPVWAEAQEALQRVLDKALIAEMASGELDISAATHIHAGTND